jgi:hypothetical protein
MNPSPTTACTVCLFDLMLMLGLLCDLMLGQGQQQHLMLGQQQHQKFSGNKGRQRQEPEVQAIHVPRAQLQEQARAEEDVDQRCCCKKVP